MLSEEERKIIRSTRLIISLFFGFYFVVISFNLLPIPFSRWLIFVGGIILLLFYMPANDNLGSFPSSYKYKPFYQLFLIIPFGIIYLLIGFYCILYVFNILPDFILNFHKWLILIGGFMMFFGQFFLYPLYKSFLGE